MPNLLNKIIKGTGALALSNVAARLLSFVTIVIITRAISLYEYGIVTLALAITGPVFSIIGLGIDDLIVADTSRYLGEGNIGKAKRLLTSYYSWRFIILVVLVVGGWFFRNLLSQRYGPVVTDAALVLLIYIVVQYFRTAFNTIFHIHKKFGTLALWNGFEPLAKFGFVIVVVWISNLTVALTLAAYVFASAVTVLLSIPQLLGVIKKYVHVQSAHGTLLKRIMVEHGKWQAFLTVVSSTVGNARYYLIKFILSTEAVAIFSVAQSMFSAIASLFPLKTIMVPIIAERVHDRKLLKVMLQKGSKYTFFIYLLITVGSIVVAPFIIPAFFPAYIASIFIFQIMALRFPLNTFSIMQVPTLIALREQRYLSFLSIVNAVFVLSMAPLLMWKFGLIGVVIEGLLTVLLMIAFREWRLRQKYALVTLEARSCLSYDEADKVIIRDIVRGFRGKVSRVFSRVVRG